AIQIFAALKSMPLTLETTSMIDAEAVHVQCARPLASFQRQDGFSSSWSRYGQWICSDLPSHLIPICLRISLSRPATALLMAFVGTYGFAAVMARHRWLRACGAAPVHGEAAALRSRLFQPQAVGRSAGELIRPLFCAIGRRGSSPVRPL